MKKSFLAVLILLMCITGVFIKGTVVSQAKSKIQEENKIYHEMEKTYIKEVKAVLEEAGFENSGVNLTKVIDENGGRAYTLLIHNSRINKLESEEKEALLLKLEGICFGDETCVIYHEFLVAYE